MWWRLVAALAAVMLGQSVASADTIRNFKVGNWFAGAYSFNGTRNFSHCAASASYRSGISMFFSINREFRWQLAFANNAWRLTPGTSFPITFAIDGGQTLNAVAHAQRSDMVTVPLADSTELFRQFRRGRLLMVGAASQVFEFKLDGTSQLLASLLECVRTKGAPPQVVANPFVGQSPAPSAPPPASSANSNAHQAEAAVTLSNILSAAGIKGFTIASGSERPELKADAFWTAGQNLAGSLRILSDANTGDVQKIQSVLIGDNAQSCKGSFASGAIPENNGQFMLRIFTACDQGGNTLTVYYLAIARPRGGLYLFSTISTGTDALAKETDSNLRSAVFRAVR